MAKGVKAGKKQGLVLGVAGAMVTGVVVLGVIVIVAVVGGLWWHGRGEKGGREMAAAPTAGSSGAAGAAVTADKGDREAVLHELLQVLAVNANEHRAAEQAAKPITPGVYSPESFTSPEVENQVAGELEAYAMEDMRYQERNKVAIARFRSRMAQVDPAYLKEWDRTRAEAEGEDLQVADLEAKWVKSVDALYLYAAEHGKEIAMSRTGASFASKDVESGFEQLLARSRGAQQAYRAAQKKALERKRRAEQKAASAKPAVAS